MQKIDSREVLVDRKKKKYQALNYFNKTLIALTISDQLLVFVSSDSK